MSAALRRHLGSVAALAALTVAAAPAGAQVMDPVNVYHSLDGVDYRSSLPPGCTPSGGGGGELITNGDFETGDLTGWTVSNAGNGNYFLASGTSAPQSGRSTAGPHGGTFYAVSDQSGPGTHALSQAFSVAPGNPSVSLDFQLFANNYGVDVIGAQGLDHTGGDNGHGRVDIVTAAGFGADPFTTDAADIVSSLFIGSDPPANPNPYMAYSFDLTAALSGGGDFVLRFAESDNRGHFNLGVDDVSLTAGGGTQCVIQGGPDEVVNLWIDGGSIDSLSGSGVNLCQFGEFGGQGSELCGADILLEVTTGPTVFTDIQPVIGTLVHHPPCDGETDEGGSCPLPPGTTQVRMNFVRGPTDPAPIPRHVANLTVDSTGASESNPTTVDVTQAAAAGANLQERTGVVAGLETVAEFAVLPEPGGMAQLLAGLAALVLLDRLRRRR